MKKAIKRASLYMMLFGLVTGLGACTSLEMPKPVTVDIKGVQSIATTAEMSQTIIQNKSTGLVTCSQPQPDTAFAQTQSGDMSLSLVTTGSGDSAGEKESSTGVELAGRTPAVLIAREMFFRACEFSVNYDLTKQEATTLFNQTLNTVAKGWGAEAASTKVTVGDTVSETSSDGYSATNSSQSTIKTN